MVVRILTLLDDILSSTSAQGRVLTRNNVPHDLGCLKSVRMRRGEVRRETRTKEVRREVRGEREREGGREVIEERVRRAIRGEVVMVRENGRGGNCEGGESSDRGDAKRGAGNGRSRREVGHEDKMCLTSHINAALNFNRENDLQHPVDTLNSKSVFAPLRYSSKLDLEDCLLMPKQGGEDPVFRSDTVKYYYHTRNEICYDITSYHIMLYLIASELNTQCNVLRLVTRNTPTTNTFTFVYLLLLFNSILEVSVTLTDVTSLQL